MRSDARKRNAEVPSWRCDLHDIRIKGDCPRCDDELIAMAREADAPNNVRSLTSRREDVDSTPAPGPPAIEMFMDDDRIIFRDQAVLDEYVRDAAATACPTCGPTETEDHPRRPGVTRCANCKEWQPSDDITPRLFVATDVCIAEDAIEEASRVDFGEDDE